jgi:membrane-bound serine protease (ClpP class)
VLQATAVDKVIDILNSPWVTGLLLVIGLIALYVELMAPGIGGGALIAAVCFVVFFWSHFLGGTAGWLEVVLFLLGVVFLAVELFVLPGFMVAGIAGAALILVSVVMAVQSFLIPQTPRQLQMLTSTLLMMLLAGVSFVVAATVLGRRFGGLGLFRHLTLAPPGPDSAGSGAAGTLPLEGFAPPPVGPGEVGVAQSYLRPGGKARFGDHYVDVLTEGDFVPCGTPIHVVRISGSQVVVEEVK